MVAQPETARRKIACFGGRSAIDEAAAAMLQQVLQEQGADVIEANESLQGLRAATVSTILDVDTVLVTFLNGNSKSHARQAVRRLKRLKPSLRVGIFVPMADGENYPRIEAGDVEADFVTTTIADTVRSAMTEGAAVELRAPVRRLYEVRQAAATA